MGWERRGRNVFYYRVSRDAAGKVVKEFLGRGEKARAAAEAVASREAQRAADQRAIETEEAKLADLDRLTNEMNVGNGMLLEAYLLGNGYHRKNYGRWRKKRGKDCCKVKDIGCQYGRLRQSEEDEVVASRDPERGLLPRAEAGTQRGRGGGTENLSRH